LIIVITSQTCERCNAIKKFLNKAELKYQEIGIDELRSGLINPPISGPDDPRLLLMTYLAMNGWELPAVYYETGVMARNDIDAIIQADCDNKECKMI
jgi:hypothetical protein